MTSSNQPDVMADVVAILVACVAAFVSIGNKILKNRGKKISGLWLGTEIGACILAFYIGKETYPLLKDLPYFNFISENLFTVLCVYSSSKIILIMENRSSKALSS